MCIRDSLDAVQQAGSLHLDHHVAVFQHTLHGQGVAVFLDVGNVGHLRQVQLLCDLRANLSGIAIDCLTAAEDNVLDVYKRQTQEKVDAIVGAITPGLKEDLCADCDLIVEAAFEDMKVKQTTFGELDTICLLYTSRCV